MSSLSRFVIGISKTFTKNPSIIGQKSCTGFDELGTKCNFNFKLLHQKREKRVFLTIIILKILKYFQRMKRVKDLLTIFDICKNWTRRYFISQFLCRSNLFIVYQEFNFLMQKYFS